MRMSFCRFMSTAAAVFLPVASLAAETYPSRPVRLVAAFTAGSSTDTIARALAVRLSERLGQNVIVDNRPGAGGVIGNNHVAKATPDGHTLLASSGVFTSVAAAVETLPYDAVRDFSWVARMVNYPLLLMVNAQSPVHSVRDLIAAAKAAPGRMSFGSVGVGSGFHLAGELLNTLAGIDLLHVPYKGSNELVTEISGGRLDMIFNTLISGQPHIQTKRLRAIGITSRGANPLLPDVPPVANTLPGYEMTSFAGIAAPGATPRAIITRLNREVNALLTLDEIRRPLLDAGGTIEPIDPAGMDRYIAGEIERWRRIARTRGVSIR
jgi:tripartite-type tricarboxylate transporter receptor subunit TctC